jgi:hypothetical protein
MAGHDELVAAFRRRAAKAQEAGLPALPLPEHWPHRWCTYEEARGFIVRLRAAGSRESKAIAAERGVTRMSVSRAVRSALVHMGEYDPEGWSRYNRERNAESRRWFREQMNERDRRVKQENAEIAQRRDAVAEHRRVMELELARELLGEPNVSTPYHSEATRKERRRALQRNLNAKNRPRAEW